MKILHIATVHENKSSGLSFSVPNLIAAQNSIENNSILFNLKNSKKINYNDIMNYDIIVLHSFFKIEHLKILLKLSQQQKLVICPRGAFSKSNFYNLKKKLYSIIYFLILKFKKNHYTFHFLTENEKNRSRFRALNEIVIGNSIKVNKYTEEITKQIVLNKFENKDVVYIGRFDTHIKGLDLLFKFLFENSEKLKNTGFKFKFYGPDNKDKRYYQNLVKENKIDNIYFFNEIYGEDKEKVQLNTTYNLLNSRSEGYPMSVLETLSYFTPQLLSKGTNLLDDLLINNFGFEINESFLEKLESINFYEYKQQCFNAYNYALKHDYKIIGKKSIELYNK
ncbi:glycosyltransferase [Empedobacter falsenii]